MTTISSSSPPSEASTYPSERQPPFSPVRSRTSYVTSLGENDVLCGRGSGPNDHAGNIKFRDLVAKRKSDYLATTNRQTKAKIAKEIVEHVESKLEPPGRFLKKVEGNVRGTDMWCLVDEATALEKAKQALRQNRGEKPSGAGAVSRRSGGGGGGGGDGGGGVHYGNQRRVGQGPSTVGDAMSSIIAAANTIEKRPGSRDTSGSSHKRKKARTGGGDAGYMQATGGSQNNAPQEVLSLPPHSTVEHNVQRKLATTSWVPEENPPFPLRKVSSSRISLDSADVDLDFKELDSDSIMGRFQHFSDESNQIYNDPFATLCDPSLIFEFAIEPPPAIDVMGVEADLVVS